MSRFGAHIRPGSRNGYGQLCTAKPAVVLSCDDGGALLEVKDKSGGYALTIFRDTSVYLEAPPDFDTYPNMTQLAQFWYQQLRVKWEQNKADYYTITNEIGGNDPAVMRRLVEYEREVMRLAKGDGFKVVVLNQATGTPESLGQWKEIYAPFIVEAWQGKNLYGRHVYGTGNLVDGSGNVTPGDPQRPFTELGYLRSLGVTGGITLSECGLDAGFGFAGTDRFKAQLGGYERLLRVYPEFAGLCAWTLGTWNPFGEDANWQIAIPDMTQYLIDNPTPKWVYPAATTPPTPIPPSSTLDQKLWSASVAEQIARGIPLNPNAGLQKAIFQDGLTPVHREISAEGVVIQAGEDVAGVKPRRVFVYEPGKDIRSFTDPAVTPVPEPPTEFRLASPVKGIPLYVNDWFNTPRSYEGNHEGIDLRATNNAGLPVPILASADGVIESIRPTDPGEGYGIYIRLRHDRQGVVWKSWYCHLSRIANGLQVGQSVLAGRELGTAGSTGNSTGVHLHLTIQKIPGGLSGFVVDDVVDPAPLLGLTPPVVTKIDLVPYFVPANGSRGNIAILKNNWGQGDERQQLQQDGSNLYVTKNSQWEKRILRATTIDLTIDTSPGNDQFYTVVGTWLPRQMAVGELFTRTETVRFFKKSDCSPVGSPYNSTSSIKFVAKHSTYVPAGGIPVNDVVELHWIVNGQVDEKYFYGRHLGLIAWNKTDGKRSWIVENIPQGQQSDNVRETGCFS